MKTTRLKILSLLGGLACLIAAGCGGGSSSSDAPQPETPSPDMVVPGPVRGSVITDRPVVGARVQLYTHDDQPLPGEAFTDDNGEFEIAVEEARYGLRVVASGGATESDGPFVGTLSAYVEPFDTDLPVPLNPVTTLADRLRVSGELTANAAESRIAAYLGLEPGRSIRSDFRYLDDFNSGAFMIAAAESGFDGLVDELVAEALADPEARRYFIGGQNLMLVADLALALLKGAVSETGSVLAGKVLASFGLGDDFSGVMRQLETISQQLTSLQATVDDIAKDVKEIKILMSVKNAEYIISRVKSAWSRLTRLDSYASDPALLADVKKDIYNTIMALKSDQQFLSDMLNGELGTPSPIQYFAEYLRDTNRFYSMQHYNKLRDFVAFYDTINVQLHYLLVEASNWDNPSDSAPSPTAKRLLDELERDRARYLALLPEPLPNDNTFVETPTMRLWYGKRDAITYPGVLKYNEVGLLQPGSENVRSEVLPAELRTLGTWTLPTVQVLQQGFSGGQDAIVARGAPRTLFPSTSQRVWTGPASQQFPIFFSPYTILFFVHNGQIDLVSDLQNSKAEFLAYRSLNDAQKNRWLPWYSSGLNGK